MSAPTPHPQSLNAARERAVKILGDAFAADAFEMDELEARLARVYRAATIAELDAVIEDVVAPAPDRSPVPVARGETSLAPARVGAFMSTARRGGRWIVPSRLEARAVMSDLTLDLREAELPAGGCEIVVRAVFANVLVLLRPGTPVTVDVGAFLANVDDNARLAAPPSRDMPDVRVTGHAAFSHVEVRGVPMPQARDDDAQ